MGSKQNTLETLYEFGAEVGAKPALNKITLQHVTNI